MQVDKLGLLIIEINNLGILIAQPGHAHGAFLAHPYSMAKAPAFEYKRIALRHNAEKCGFQLEVGSHIL